VTLAALPWPAAERERDEDQPAEAAELARDRTSDLYAANQLAIGNRTSTLTN
jgi:hypothetical protein